jgi:hypothetical protein
MRKPQPKGRGYGQRRPLAERFWSKVRKTETCWIWTASLSTAGYGQFGTSRGVLERAHRVAWRLTGKPLIPDGAVLMHACDNRLCVNPAHLSIGTQRDNVRDAVEKGRARGQFAPVDVCKHGHPFDEKNTLIDGRGRKSCRACCREKMRRRRGGEHAD